MVADWLPGWILNLDDWVFGKLYTYGCIVGSLPPARDGKMIALTTSSVFIVGGTLTPTHNECATHEISCTSMQKSE